MVLYYFYKFLSLSIFVSKYQVLKSHELAVFKEFKLIVNLKEKAKLSKVILYIFIFFFNLGSKPQLISKGLRLDVKRKNYLDTNRWGGFLISIKLSHNNYNKEFFDFLYYLIHLKFFQGKVNKVFRKNKIVFVYYNLKFFQRFYAIFLYFDKEFINYFDEINHIIFIFKSSSLDKLFKQLFFLDLFSFKVSKRLG